MSAAEKIDKNLVRLTVTVTPERFQEGLRYSYNKNKNQINIPGFRKGKAPRKVIERMYGGDFFYDDAINFVLPDAYEQALDENGVEPVYRPTVKLDNASEQDGVTFTAEVYVKPEVEIDGYYGLTYDKTDTEPAEADIQAKLQAEREKNARIVSVGRPAEMGDIVSINFTGYTDGEPFEGGKAEDYDLTLGSNAFIGTFEEQLVGRSVGDDVDINVTFPEDYNHKELAGKDALFKVEVLDVKTREYPEIDDDFAQDVSEFETLAEYRQSLSEKIREEKEQQAKRAKQDSVLRQLAEKAVMDVPDVMYKAEAELMLEDMKYRLSQQNMSFDMYLQFAQTTEEGLLKTYEEQARATVNNMLALEAVAKKEGLDVTGEEYDAHIAHLAEHANKPPEELKALITPEREKELKKDLINQKAMDFVLDKAVAVG